MTGWITNLINEEKGVEMKKGIIIHNADNMPIQAPFYKSPNNPQECPGLKTITVFCRIQPEIIKKYLEPTPFEYLTDQFIIQFGDYSNGSAAAFYDAAIVIPVKYKDITGGYYLIEYEDLASSVIGGRELWGYPKKEATFSVTQKDNRIVGVVSREEHEILRVEIDMDKTPNSKLPDISAYPNLLLWTLPRYDGPGIQSQKILSRDTSKDLVVKKTSEVWASVKLSKYENLPVMEPLDEWNPVEVYGARYIEGDYYCTEERGWASLVDVIIRDKDSMRGNK